MEGVGTVRFPRSVDMRAGQGLPRAPLRTRTMRRIDGPFAGSREWDIADTHGYRLPAKWICQAGRIMILLFSGTRPNDAFLYTHRGASGLYNSSS